MMMDIIFCMIMCMLSYIYIAVWAMTPSNSSTAFVVRNHAAPGATMQFKFNPAEKWWDITFDVSNAKFV